MRAMLVITSEADVAAIPWAAHIAAMAGGGLCIVCPRKAAESDLAKVADAAANSSPLIQAVVAAATGVRGSPVVYDAPCPSVYRGILDAARDLEVDLLVLPAAVSDASASDSLVRRLARGAPYDVVVLHAEGAQFPPRRTLVPQIDGGGAFSLAFAARNFGDAEHPIVALPDPAALPRANRVFKRVAERVAAKREVAMSQAAGGRDIDQAIREELAAGDLVLFDADDAGRTPRLLTKLADLHGAHKDIPFAVAVVREEEAAGAGRFERILEEFRRHAPVLSREERRDLHQQLEKGGRLSIDFVVMLSLSAAIAALGLIQSSASVVIGAMLVAPLMTPLVAIGMALAQGNLQLFRTALRAMSLGIVGALLVSMGIALLSPWPELSAEVVARGSPNVFDLMIAFLSGVAASFALARPGISGTLVGVAIAVALVPPLAAVGISTVKAHHGVAFGAAILFIANLLAIVVGATLVFRIFGIDPSVRGEATRPWVRTTLVLIAASLLVTTAVLASNLLQQTREGVHRPYARPLPRSLREAILARVAREPGVEVLLMAQSEIEHGFGVELLLSAQGTVDPGLTTELRTLVEDSMAGGIPCRVRVVRGVGGGN